MKRIILILSVPLLAFGNLQHDYLNMGISPRVQALGGVGEISSVGPDSVYFCPALLVNNNKTFQAGITFPGVDQQMTYIYSKQGVFTVGLVINQVANIEDRVGRSDEADSYSTAMDAMLVIGSAKKIGYNTALGANILIFGDNYQDQSTGRVMFTIGGAHKFSDTLQASLTNRFCDNGSVGFVSGVKVGIIDDITLYSTQELYNGVLSSKEGVAISIEDTIDILAGYNGVGLSFGLSLKTDGFSLDTAYTDTPIGGQCSVGISLGSQK